MSTLATAGQVCFFMQGHSVHLILRYELLEPYTKPPEGSPHSPVVLLSQTDLRRSKISSHTAHCRICDSSVGSLNAVGPLRENTLCFQSKTASLWRDDCELRGDWSTVMKFLSSLVSVRDLNSFYGDAALPDTIASLGNSRANLVFPTPNALMNLSLRELSLQRPRPYQIECFLAAALRNSIVYLPTGAGKTLVAAMLISLYHKLNPQKVAILIVDRVPLAHQQGSYLLQQTNLNTLIACGENSDQIPFRKLRSFPVIVVTAEVLINWMIRGWLSMADLSMIVFDEIHHAVKMHPYARLIETYYRPCGKLSRPRLVGLTASPTEGGPVSMHTSLANLCDLSEADVFMPCVYWDTLLECINRPQIAFHIAEPGPQELEMSRLISDYCSSILRTIVAKLGVSPSTDVLPSIDSGHFRGFLRALVERAHGLKCEISVQLLLHVQQVYGAQGLCGLLGSRYAREYLNDFFIGKQLSFNPAASEELLKQIQRFDSRSQKVYALLTVLQSISATSETRAIIFVQTKKTARYLCRILEAEADLKAKWNPTYFVGRGAGQVDGMSWADDQSPILQKFRSGEYKLLISTSVLQEGIDVPVCDHVILLDQTWTLTSFIQSRGRARAQDSHYLLLCTDTEREAYENLIMAETDMHRVVLQFMALRGTLTKEIALGSIHHACLVAKVENWASTEHGAAGQGDEAQASLDSLQRSYRSIQLTLHNLPLGSEGLTLDSFDFLSDLLLKNMSGELEDDNVFSDKKAFVVRAEPTGGWPLRLHDVTKMASELAARLVTHDAVVSYRLGSQANASGLDHTFFMAEELHLGTLQSPREFLRLKALQFPIKVGLNMNLGLIQAYFGSTVDHTVYRIDFDLKSVNRFILVDDDPTTATTLLYIPIKDSVAFYSAQGRAEANVKLTTLDCLAWERASVQDMALFADFTDVFTFRLTLTLGRLAKHNMLAALHRVEAYNLALVYGKVSESECLPGMLSRQDLFTASLWTRDFGTGYDFQVLLSTCTAILLYRTPREGFLGPLMQLVPTLRHWVMMELILDLDKAVLPNTISRLERVIATTLQFASDPILPRPYDSSDATSNESDSSALIRFVVLTPTRLLYLLPRKMPRNRILRAFNPEYFLRVQFRDEDLQKLSTTKSSAGIRACFERVGDFLRRGLVIADRKYEFLAMSSSQLRDHGCWFMAPHHIVGPSEDGLGLQETYVDVEYIRNWCGDFAKIKNVAKYVARLGQSLSSSQNVASLSSECVELIPDYEVTRQVRGTSKTFVFSDGIGMLTFALAKKISCRLGLSRVASAYQIRFGGCKGVLAVNPNSTEDDPTERIWLRPSMIKFASTQHSLEVLNYSNYIPAYLNRQFITILSSLGVPDQAFISLQEGLFREMSEMLIDGKAARTAITSCQTILPVISTDQIGSKPLYMEPFCRSLLLALYRRMLTELLTRSRAFVPMGRVLMGVIDETGTLGEDEIFVQLTRQPHDCEAMAAGLVVPVDDEDKGLVVVTAEVTIAKNPCMHPGDVRRLKAVRSPLLQRYHFDCVVFPRNGPRPITDMCSGSDLDGDLYLVTWDPNLLPPKLYEPMDYFCPAAKEVDHITEEDVRKFLVDFMANDQLGTIANAHVAHSDLLPQGVASPLCMQLAYIFSLAVDFPKTGLIPAFPSEARVQSWPDFMQKSGATTHISTKVIGRMFRKAKSIHFLAAPLNPERPKLDQSLLAPGYQPYLEASRQLYHEYCDLLSCVLRTYGLVEEAPLFTNSHIEPGVGMSKEESKDVLKMVVRSVKEIVSKYRERFHQGTDSATNLSAKASAWYYVAYMDAVKPRGLSSPILSFPWIVSDYLQSIPAVQGGHDGVAVPSAPILQKDYGGVVVARGPAEQDGHKGVAVSSFLYVLGEQAIRAAVEMIDQEVRPAAVERLNFYFLLRNLLQEVTGAGTRIELSGSLNGLFHNSASDVNVFLDIDDQKLSGLVLDQLSKTFCCHHRPGIVEYRGDPFHFTIFNRVDLHKPSLMLRDVFYSRPSLMALFLVIAKWGRAQHLLRRSIRHSRHMSATALALLVCETHASLADNPWDGLEGRTPTKADESVATITGLKSALLELPSGEVEAMGGMILQFFQGFAFAPDPADLSTGRGENLKLLHDYCFKAYQLLVQSMMIENLWKVIYSSDIELDLVLAKRNPRLLRKGRGQQCSVFMEGSSVLLFEGSESQQDAVGFELYQFQRRPQHFTAQCYSPVLATPKLLPFDPADRESHVYQQYFAHFYRQFDMARRLGSPEYGLTKLAIKYGCSYITNLPRLFHEDGTAATVQKAQQALSLGYSAVSDVGTGKFFKSKRGGFALDLPRGKNVLEIGESDSVVPDSTDVVEKIIKSLDEGGEPLKFLKPVLSKKKTSLTAMSSSFEPFVVNEERLKAFMAKIELEHREDHASTAISLNLYNSSMDGNCGFQVMYDEQMQFIKMRYQPLRWMVIDVRGRETDGRDYRFLLSSAKDVDLEDVEGQGEGPSMTDAIAADIKIALKEGIVELVPDGDSRLCAPRLRVRKEFRNIEGLMARVSRTATYSFPDQASISTLLSLYPHLGTVSREVLQNLQLRLSQVVEHSNVDAESGLFVQTTEKSEMSIDWKLDWTRLQQDHDLAISVIPSLWTLAHFFRDF